MKRIIGMAVEKFSCPFLIGKVITKRNSKRRVNNSGSCPFLIGKVITQK